MKKVYFILIMFVYSNILFGEDQTVLLSEDFNNHPISATNRSQVGWAPEGWDNWDFDGGTTPYGKWFGIRTYKSTWLPRYDENGAKYMISASYLTESDINTADDWLVTKSITLPSDKSTVVRFSVKSFGPDSFRDGIWVYLIKNSVYENLKESTPEDELSAAFVDAATLVYSEENVSNTEWIARWAPLNSLKGESVRVMFRNKSTNCFYVGLDDISIAVEENQTFPDPINLTATQIKKDVKLTWEAPADTPNSYDIFRNGEKIGDSTTATYTHEGIGIAEASAEYCVKSVYTGGSSEGICTSINIVPYTLHPIQELKLSQERNNVILTWKAPQSGTGIFSHYKVSRNGTVLTNELNALTYTDPEIGATAATLEYCVEAVYDDESSSPVCESIAVTPYEFPKLQNIDIRQAKNNIMLSWEKPDPMAAYYQIYRNGEMIVEELHYRYYEDVDIVTTSATIEYCIKVKYFYPEEGMSNATCVSIDAVPVGNKSEFFTSFEGDKLPDGWNNRKPYQWKSAPINWSIFSGNIPFDEEFYWWDGYHYNAGNEGAIETEEVLIAEGKTDLSFDLALRRNSTLASGPGLEFYVDVSSDNGETWKPITENLARKISGWPANDGDATLFIDLTEYIGQNIKLAFRAKSTANYTMLAMDNIRLGAAPENAEYGVTALDQYYTQIPLTHATVDLTGASIHNKGAIKNGGTLSVAIGSSYNETYEIPAIGREESKTVTPSIPFTATEIGDITITYTSQIDGDNNPNNNTASTSFTVTESLFAVDNGTYKGNLGSNMGALSIGHEFRLLNDLNTVTAFEIAFGDYTVPTFTVSIFSIDANKKLKEIYTSEVLSKKGTVKEFSEYLIETQDLKKGNYLFTVNQLDEYNIGLAYDNSGKVSKWNLNGSIADQSGFGAVCLRIKTEEPSPFRPVEYLEGTDTGDDILLSWDHVNDNVVSYTIYRDGNEIASNVTSLGYSDPEVGKTRDTYNYCVVAVYPESSSRPICISVTATDCPKVIDLEAKKENDDIRLTWTSKIPPIKDTDEEYLFFEGFNSGIPYYWRNIDADGDTYKWVGYINGAAEPDDVYEGNGYASSQSVVEIQGAGATPLSPDNWLITPAIPLTRENKLTYAIKAENSTNYEEHYSVLISTTGGANAAAFTRIFEETLTSSEWVEKEIDLSNYSGEIINIAFQHYNCTNMDRINLDAVGITYGVPYPEVTFTVLRDEVEIASNLETTEFLDQGRGLINGEYNYCVVANYSDGSSLECTKIRVGETNMESVESQIFVYPSLTKGKVTIKTPAASTIKVMNVSGQLMDIYNTTEELNLDLNYSDGIYFIVVEMLNTTSTYKIILKK